MCCPSLSCLCPLEGLPGALVKAGASPEMVRATSIPRFLENDLLLLKVSRVPFCPPRPSSLPAPPRPHHPLCAHGPRNLHTRPLVVPSTTHPAPRPSWRPHCSCFLISDPLCSAVCHVTEIPHGSESTGYLSCSDRFVSCSVTPPRSLRASPGGDPSSAASCSICRRTSFPSARLLAALGCFQS